MHCRSAGEVGQHGTPKRRYRHSFAPMRHVLAMGVLHVLLCHPRDVVDSDDEIRSVSQKTGGAKAPEGARTRTIARAVSASNVRRLLRPPLAPIVAE